MNRPTFVKRKMPSENAGEIELDLTPMISMFLILLPFLVSMAVLTHLTTLEFSLPPNMRAGLGGGTSEKPKIKLTVVIAPQYLAVTYGERMFDSLSANNSGYDFDKLIEVLKKYRQEMSLENELVIASQDEVRLKNVVALMDCCKNAGFIKIGLSNAARVEGSL